MTTNDCANRGSRMGYPVLILPSILIKNYLFEFGSIREAGIILNIPYTSISKCANNKIKSVQKKYIFRFLSRDI